MGRARVGSGKGQKERNFKQRGQHQQVQGDQHSVSREAEVSSSQVYVQGWEGGGGGHEPCILGYSSKSHSRILNRGVLTFYRAHSSSGEVMPGEGKETGRPLKIQMADPEVLSKGSGIRKGA